MAAIKSVNIDRIRWCMADRNITAEELAAEIGVKDEKIRAILNGEEALSLTQLKNIAKYFNRGLLFFISQGEVNETKLRTSGFRTLTNQHPGLDAQVKALMERVERQRQIFLSLREELGEDEMQSFQPPRIDQHNPKAAASVVREWLNVNDDCSFDGYRRSIELKGILVFRSNPYIGPWRVPSESEIEGFSIYHDNYPIIFVRKREARQRELFTLAHELGHLILHREGSIDSEENIFSVQSREREVNAFAGHLLVPEDALSRIVDSQRPHNPQDFDDWLRNPARNLGVSVEVLLRRLLDDGRLSRNAYKAYRTWKNEQVSTLTGFAPRSYRHREPVGVFGKSFVGTVLEALGAKQITITKASRFLDNIKITDVHKLQREFNRI
jgi:Zn-dependent peptidase ImmA (M78 family)/transcriptional regulator with XRE-family HTH domain